MVLRITLLSVLLLPWAAYGNSVYKCMRDDKVIFSQTACPSEYRQHRIEYELGITTEIDSDKRSAPKDHLRELLSNQSLSSEKLLKLLDAEIYRLQQENSYFQILQASEIKKLERKRYWQKKGQDDPEYLKERTIIDEHFKQLTLLNNSTIELLEQHKQKLSLTSEQAMNE
ncbi:DUF4124 domain-containing protein [Shewanella corallii]|uniref:DUF4124 domain-containing protein n=1 Tax=Shewanella corallii TaxID=560080 RepID=A0ABT0N2X5_9GAMM|nr:DUF4124 domain-containing protein [Shewanella corallii]MCL2912515.1 DUF4124 domain-containing protein [Shewanella corallii]